jgi:hypothetical protein
MEVGYLKSKRADLCPKALTELLTQVRLCMKRCFHVCLGSGLSSEVLTCESWAASS